MAGNFLPVARGTVTQANMKISAVDGTAFVDFSEAAQYQSDFSASVDSWEATTNVSVDGNIDGIGGEDNNLRIICNNVSGTHNFSRQLSFTKNQRQKVVFSIYIPSANSNVAGIYLDSGYWGIAEYITPPRDTWTTYTRYIYPTYGTMFFRLTNGTSISFQDAGGDDVIYLRAITVQNASLIGHLGHLLVIRDSSGRAIQGFIKAAGTAETEGDELATGTCTALKLYKITATESNHFGTGKVVGNYFTSAGTETLDANNKVKEISTPSATGVTIVSTKGGTTYNFAQKNSSFNYNDASGYTYEIYKVLNAPSVSTNTGLTAANEHLATVDGGAFYFGSIDLTNYQDGRHMLWLKDTSGYVAFARIKAETPAGETLGSEFITSWTNSVTYPYNTFTLNANGHDIDAVVGVESGTKAANTNSGMSIGTLYKIVSDITLTSGTGPVLRTIIGASILSSALADSTIYRTAHGTDSGLQILNWDTAINASLLISCKPMTVPPATGALLENMAGTRNMIYKHASFNPNAISEIRVLHIGD